MNLKKQSNFYSGMNIYARNPGTSKLFRVRYKPDTRLTRPQQTDSLEPRVLELSLSRDTAKTVRQFAEIYITKNDRPIFHGYAEKYEIDNSKEKTLTCPGAENLLTQRWALPYYWPAGTSFEVAFGHGHADEADPGLLTLANSVLPPGFEWEYYDEDENVVKIVDAGSRYRLGRQTLYALDYRHMYLLGEITSFTDFDYVDNAFLRDTTDLYVKIKLGKNRGWADVGGLLIENAFDSLIRLGNIDCTTKTLRTSLQTNYDRPIADILTDAAKSHDATIRLRDDKQYTYLDFVDADVE